MDSLTLPIIWNGVGRSVAIDHTTNGMSIKATSDGRTTSWTVDVRGSVELIAETAARRQFGSWALTVDDALGLVAALARACAEAQSA